MSSGGFVVLLAKTRGEKPFSFFRTQRYASSTFLVGCMRDVLQDMLNAVTRQRKHFCFVCVWHCVELSSSCQRPRSAASWVFRSVISDSSWRRGPVIRVCWTRCIELLGLHADNYNKHLWTCKNSKAPPTETTGISLNYPSCVTSWHVLALPLIADKRSGGRSECWRRIETAQTVGESAS